MATADIDEGVYEAALRAWADYQRDGLHLTAEEADEWLARLMAGEDADPPPCHP